MLNIPEHGFFRSVEKNNVSTIALGDWIEASALLLGDEFSRSDVVDILVEQGITDRQEMGVSIAEAGWSELEYRLRATGTKAGIFCSANRIGPSGVWQDDIARSFLLVLTLMDFYSDWSKKHRDVNKQGDLFERLCVEACGHIFYGWSAERAGWSAGVARPILQLVADMTATLGTLGNQQADKWVGENAKDAGLDVLCFRPFDDGREGAPMFMIQCASGENWPKKLTEPPTGQWQILLQSSFKPMRAVMVPFIVDEQNLRISCTRIEGPLFDRLRILSAAEGSSQWVSAELHQELKNWLTPVIAELPAL